MEDLGTAVKGLRNPVFMMTAQDLALEVTMVVPIKTIVDLLQSLSSHTNCVMGCVRLGL